MTDLATHQDICRQFARLLSYPDAQLQQTTADCLQQLRESRPAAAGQLQKFAAFLAKSSSSQIEEVFTATFDLQPVCHPYVGYQLCGESQQRTMFLMKLQEIYRQHDYRPDSELPDHLSEILQFIGITADQSCRQELISDGLLPALAKLIPAIESDDHPYKALLTALQTFLTAGSAEQGGQS